jgi:hypothetical protein
VVPLQPGQPAAVGADAGAGVKVAARRQHHRLAVAVGGHGDQLVADLAVGVAFADADQPAGVGGGAGVGVAVGGRGGRLGGDGPGPLAVRVEAVQALVAEVAEEQGLAGQCVAAAAVLVDPGAGVEPLGDQVLDRAARNGAADDLAAALQGPALDPAHGRPGDPDLVQRDAAGGDQLGADRRRPGAVGDGGHAATRGAR